MGEPSGGDDEYLEDPYYLEGEEYGCSEEEDEEWHEWTLPEEEHPPAEPPEPYRVEAVPSGRVVHYTDLSKPYAPPPSNHKSYSSYLVITSTESPVSEMSPSGEGGAGDSELAGLSPEQQEAVKKEWADELAKIEEEIQTLRHVLSSKMRTAQELKRKLGFSVWKEFQEDMSQGIRNVKESHVYQTVEEKVGQISRAVVEAPIYQKTESLVKGATEKTSSILGGFGSGITHKLGQIKNSESFRSFEERVGSAYENVKTKVTPSRSASAQSFMDALREGDERPRTNPSSPIQEDKIA